MSEALEEVRNVKFRMARRSGYEVIDVDEFIDRMEGHVTALIEENRRLQDELARLRQQPPG